MLVSPTSLRTPSLPALTSTVSAQPSRPRSVACRLASACAGIGICLLAAAAGASSPGSLDPLFDGDGKRLVAFDRGGDLTDHARNLVMDSNGTAIAIGTVEFSRTDTDFGLVRIDSHGVLDPTFGSGGMLTIPFDLGGTLGDFGTAVTIQPQDGRILAAGPVNGPSGNLDFGVARLLPDGSLDPSFDGDGKTTFGFDIGGGNDDRVTSIEVDPMGRIVVAGWSTASGTSGDFDWVAARLLADGSLDPTFDFDGRKVLPIDLGGLLEDRCGDMLVQPDGKVVLTGRAETATGSRMVILRLEETGAIDLGFGVSGRVILSFDGLDRSSGAGLAILPDGRLLVVGSSDDSTLADMAIARLHSDGSLDASFDGDGRATVDFGGNWDRAEEVLVLPDGRIVLGGGTADANLNTDFAFVRLEDDGSLDLSFGSNGKSRVAFDRSTRGTDRLSGLGLWPDGKLLAAGGTEIIINGDWDYAFVQLEGP